MVCGGAGRQAMTGPLVAAGMNGGSRRGSRVGTLTLRRAETRGGPLPVILKARLQGMIISGIRLRWSVTRGWTGETIMGLIFACRIVSTVLVATSVTRIVAPRRISVVLRRAPGLPIMIIMARQPTSEDRAGHHHRDSEGRLLGSADRPMHPKGICSRLLQDSTQGPR